MSENSVKIYFTFYGLKVILNIYTGLELEFIGIRLTQKSPNADSFTLALKLNIMKFSANCSFTAFKRSVPPEYDSQDLGSEPSSPTLLVSTSIIK